MSTVLPYGSWPSPLSAEAAATASPRFEGAAFCGDEIWWGESLPAQKGRTTVRRHADGDVEDLLPAPWNARSTVHEYGGGSWTVAGDRLVFVEKTDQRVWSLRPGGEPVALTPAAEGHRHGGLRWQAGRLLAVREVHAEGRTVPLRHIVEIDLDGGGVAELAGGSDFVAQPALSPDGSRLAWVAWDHPAMPWDRTRIRVRGLSDAGADARDVTGLAATAALQPEWTADGALLLLDEPGGRWSICRVDPDRPGDISPVALADADTGGPLWVLGLRWYAPLADGRIVAIRTNGDDRLVLVAADGAESQIDLPATARLNIEAWDDSRVLVSGAGASGTGIWLVDATGPDVRVEPVRTGSSGLAPEWIPRARPVVFDGPFGPVPAFDFPPTNPHVRAPEGERAPYVVLVHGGPTSHVGGVADTRTVFFTSRGIGVLDVNYGGSSGYGRQLRERLNGQWGVVDVADVAAAAAGLAAEGRADAERLAIAGGSAGGWTVLSALATTDVFAAGISRYGVADARTLAADTHDFEARYLDGLIGPLPDAEQLYIDRSPLSHADGLTAPVLLLQGSDDAVVPPSQSEAVRDALAANGTAHAYVLYEGEGHGFRQAETIVHAMQTELAFLGRVFGFDTPDVPPLELTGDQRA